MKTFFKKYGTIAIAFAIANLFLVNKSFGQTATVTFDYTGASFTCGTDNTYTPTSTSLTVSSTGIPASATITGISFTGHLGSFSGTTNVTFTLNGTSIGVLSASNNTCVTGNIASVSIPLFNKTGPNTLAVTISGGTLPGVYNGVFTVTYTNCTPPSAPSVTTPVNLCLNGSSSQLTATGSNLKWYASDGVTVLPTAPTPSTSSAGTTSYYVSQTISCESAKAQIVVNVGSLPTASVNIGDKHDLSCNLGTDGSIKITASGGSGSGYYFSIDNGTHYYNSNSNSGTVPPFYIPNAFYTQPGAFSGLPAGTYKIRVKDGNGCESKSIQ